MPQCPLIQTSDTSCSSLSTTETDAWDWSAWEGLMILEGDQACRDHVWWILNIVHAKHGSGSKFQSRSHATMGILWCHYTEIHQDRKVYQQVPFMFTGGLSCASQKQTSIVLSTMEANTICWARLPRSHLDQKSARASYTLNGPNRIFSDNTDGALSDKSIFFFTIDWSISTSVALHLRPHLIDRQFAPHTSCIQNVWTPIKCLITSTWTVDVRLTGME